jgi:DNA repair exonuclease SbcCD ATPase subunit
MTKRGDAVAQTSENDGQAAQSKTQSRQSVIKYVIVLGVVVLFFIFLSYFIQQRSSHKIETLYAENSSAQQKIENLQSANVQLQTKNSDLTAAATENEKKITELEAQIEDIRAQWAQDTKQIEDRYKADYNELLTKYNELLEQVNAAAAAAQAQDAENNEETGI